MKIRGQHEEKYEEKYEEKCEEKYKEKYKEKQKYIFNPAMKSDVINFYPQTRLNVDTVSNSALCK